MITTTTINIQLGTAFWLLIAVFVVGIMMWSKLGSEGMSRVLSSGVRDAFTR
jgi:hypothetical protein